MLAGQNSSPGGMSYVAHCKGDRLRVKGVGTPLLDDTERKAIRINSIRIPQEDMWRAPLSRLPQGEAHGTREHHTPDDSISYPDMLSRSLTKVSKPCYSPRSAALRWCVRTSFPWIPKNSPQSRIALVIKKLSKHQNLTQFD